MSVFTPGLGRQSAPPTCNIQWICKQLGFRGSDAARVKYVSGLIATHGFPPPLPHLKWGGGISDAVNATRSEWLRAGVLKWFDDYMPPAAAAALEEQAELAAAEEMDRAAGNLALVGGTEAA